ncbi:hypothetical protein ONZ45_g15198 [Pleurotus djamor]|nr:hypothetical protein ONZ45_g15198 [Pleurotus djamor]
MARTHRKGASSTQSQTTNSTTTAKHDQQVSDPIVGRVAGLTVVSTSLSQDAASLVPDARFSNTGVDDRNPKDASYFDGIDAVMSNAFPQVSGTVVSNDDVIRNAPVENDVTNPGDTTLSPLMITSDIVQKDRSSPIAPTIQVLEIFLDEKDAQLSVNKAHNDDGFDTRQPMTKSKKINVSKVVPEIKATDIELYLNLTPFRSMQADQTLSMYPDQPLLYRERFYDDGVYQYLYKKILDGKVSEENRPKMLATAELNRDFKTVNASESSIACVRKDGSIALFSCFGEVATAMQGTRMSAKGNHFSVGGAENFKFIRDENTIKNILILCAPSVAPPAIKELFMKQILLLEEIMGSVESLVEEGGESFPWTRSTEGKEGFINAIAVSTPRIYTMPTNASNSKDARVVRQLGGQDGHKSVVYPTDFGGAYFQLRKAKLAQQEFYDIDNNLIPPWEAYDKLRPGTLVSAQVSLECYVKPQDKKKYYQVRMHKLSVIAESPEVPEPRQVPALPLEVRARERIMEKFDDLDDFRPAKKHKLSHA